jgi:peptide/nickel transport system permease protein
MIQPVILWTDALIFLLLAFVIGFTLYAGTREHLRSPWQRVFSSRMAAVSAVVLLVFIIIGMLDSMHFRLALEDNGDSVGNGEVHYAVEVLSVFDALVGPIRTQPETTYSAPFAAHSFSKESIGQAEGVQARDYPRLEYGGRHLDDPLTQCTADIVSRSSIALLQAAGATALLLIAISLFLRKRYQTSLAGMVRLILINRTRIPWRVIVATLGFMLVLLCLAINLTGVYHVFGTDKVGQDVFYQTLKSIRTGLVIGTLTTLVMLPFAVMLGIIAGYARGWVDDVIQYLYTTLSSIPGVLLIAAGILML